MDIIWFLLVIAPLTLFIHELGHSLGAYIVKSDKIQLFFGVGKRIKSFSIKRWTVHLHSFYMLGGHTVSERDPYYSKMEQVIISLFGPLLNGWIGILGTFLFSNHSGVLLIFILFNFWLCIINLIPYRIGSRQSDGYAAVKALFSKERKDQSL